MEIVEDYLIGYLIWLGFQPSFRRTAHVPDLRFFVIGFSKSQVRKKGFTYAGNTRVNAPSFFRPGWPAGKKIHMRRSSETGLNSK